MHEMMAAFFMASLFACALQMQVLARPVQEMDWLSARDGWIVDSHGNKVILRGANYNGMEFGWFEHTESDFALMRSWGFDVVRFPIAWGYVEPVKGTYDSTYLERLDKVVGWCKDNGLYVIIDMHQWNWAPKFGGNGLPDWAVEPYKDQDEAKVAFYTDEKVQQRFFDAWKYVAARYANEPAVVAYDVFNEANANYDQMPRDEFVERLRTFYENAIDSIREVDSRHMIMIEPPWGAEVEALAKVERTNLVLSTHLYTEGTSDGKTGYDGRRQTLESDFLRGYALAREWGVPLFVGEFGIGSAATLSREWARDMLDIMDRYMVGSTWWAFWRDDKEFGLLDQRGNEKREIVSVLERIYPKRFMIAPVNFSYDVELDRFEISWDLPLESEVGATVSIPRSLRANLSSASNLAGFEKYISSDATEAVLSGNGSGELWIILSPTNLDWLAKYLPWIREEVIKLGSENSSLKVVLLILGLFILGENLIILKLRKPQGKKK